MIDKVCSPCRLIYAGWLDMHRCDICGLPLLSRTEEESEALNNKWASLGDSLWYRLAYKVLNIFG